MAITKRQFDRYFHLRPNAANVPFWFPASTNIQTNALAGLFLPQKTDLTHIPTSTSAAGAAITVVPTAATDIMTLTAHSYGNGQVLQISTSGTMPAPLAVSTNYYVVNRTADTFQLAASRDGVPIDITSAGSGTISATIPAGSPWVAFSDKVGLPCPCPMSVCPVFLDASGGGSVATVRIEGFDYFGNAIKETVTVTCSGTTATGVQTNQAFRAVTAIYVDSFTATPAAGDKANFGVFNGLNASIATSPRANYGLPLVKPVAGVIKGVYTGSAGYFSNTTTAGVANTVIQSTTYPTFQMTSAASGDTASTTQGYGVIQLDPSAVS